MLAKLLAILAQAKGAAVGTVIVVAGATTVTVGATNHDVQETVNQIVANVGLTQKDSDSCEGQPAVVAQRNAADKLLRAAYQSHHKQLLDLRPGGKDVDGQQVALLMRTYDGELRDTLNKALNDVAALTLGREGQLKKDTTGPSGGTGATGATGSSGSSGPSGACPPTGGSGSSGASGASGSSGTSGATGATGATGEDKGRVAVANRTTLDAAIKTIVDDAVKAMDQTITDATDALSHVPAPEHGKPSDQGQGNKPAEPGKPADKGKPSR